MKTKSLWYSAPNELDVREIDIPSPGCGEVLVRVEACGVCTWDLFIYQGGFSGHVPFPFYFGHEGVGVVEEIGPGVESLKQGDRIALKESPIIGRLGYGHMAKYALQPAATAVKLPTDADPVRWMIEPAACCVNGVDLANIRCGDKVALVGCGFMGSVILQLLSLTPAASIHVFDIRPESLSYAKEKAKTAPISVYDPRETNTDEMFGTFDVVIESAATESAFRLADNLVRRGGTLEIFSWHHKEFAFDFGRWHERGLTVMNTSPAANPHFGDCFLQARSLMEVGRLDVGELVTHVSTPEDAPELFSKGVEKRDGYMKGVIRWS